MRGGNKQEITNSDQTARRGEHYYYEIHFDVHPLTPQCRSQQWSHYVVRITFPFTPSLAVRVGAFRPQLLGVVGSAMVQFDSPPMGSYNLPIDT